MNVLSVYSSVTFTFISLGTEEYICVIFLGTEEFKKTEEYFLFSVMVCKLDFCAHIVWAFGLILKLGVTNIKIYIYKELSSCASLIPTPRMRNSFRHHT
jgi:hypothetical protein